MYVGMRAFVEGNQSQFESLSLSRRTTDLELILFHHVECADIKAG